jgi:hypothetical protein
MATDLHRHGWSRPTLVAELGIGFAMPKASVLASGLARVTSPGQVANLRKSLS